MHLCKSVQVSFETVAMPVQHNHTIPWLANFPKKTQSPKSRLKSPVITAGPLKHVALWRPGKIAFKKTFSPSIYVQLLMGGAYTTQTYTRRPHPTWTMASLNLQDIRTLSSSSIGYGVIWHLVMMAVPMAFPLYDPAFPEWFSTGGPNWVLTSYFWNFCLMTCIAAAV